nr:hypothetical protein K-LCC10_0348 [Kaumoebavirus]
MYSRLPSKTSIDIKINGLKTYSTLQDCIPYIKTGSPKQFEEFIKENKIFIRYLPHLFSIVQEHAPYLITTFVSASWEYFSNNPSPLITYLYDIKRVDVLNEIHARLKMTGNVNIVENVAKCIRSLQEICTIKLPSKRTRPTFVAFFSYLTDHQKTVEIRGELTSTGDPVDEMYHYFYASCFKENPRDVMLVSSMIQNNETRTFSGPKRKLNDLEQAAIEFLTSSKKQKK